MLYYFFVLANSHWCWTNRTKIALYQMHAGPEIEKIGIKKEIKKWEDRRREGREVEEIR